MGRPSDRKFRFGVQVRSHSLEEWQAWARKLEQLGFSTLLVPDHFAQEFAPLPALVAAAGVTSTLRLGTLVLANDFRHPAVLAREAATVDALSGGRLELGIGSGWSTSDYQQAGIPFGTPAERLERLQEAVHICKRYFEEESVTFQGKHYQVEGLNALPRSVQKPRPPLMIGGRQRRMLTYAAQEADIVSISMLDRRVPNARPAPFGEKVDWVRAGAGARYPNVEIEVMVSEVHVTENRQAALDEISRRLQTPRGELEESPAVLVGTVEHMIEQVCAWRQAYDLSYLVILPQAVDAFAPIVERLAGR